MTALKERLKVHEVPSWAEYLPANLCASFFWTGQLGGEQKISSAAQAEGVPAVLGQVWELSQDAAGCRDVQLFLETCSSEEALAAVAEELHGHVEEAMRCPHANHVLQKLITAVDPWCVQFVVDELMATPGAAELAARHKYGCRIVQRLLKECWPQQVQALAKTLLVDANALAQNPYGNYVVQKLLEHGTPQLKRSLAAQITLGVDVLCRNVFSSAVIKSALQVLAKGDAQSLARSILRTPGLLAFLAHDRRCGHAVLGLLSEVLRGDDLKLVKQCLERGSRESQRQRRSSARPEAKPSVLKIADFLEPRPNKVHHAGA